MRAQPTRLTAERATNPFCHWAYGIRRPCRAWGFDGWDDSWSSHRACQTWPPCAGWKASGSGRTPQPGLARKGNGPLAVGHAMTDLAAHQRDAVLAFVPFLREAGRAFHVARVAIARHLRRIQMLCRLAPLGRKGPGHIEKIAARQHRQGKQNDEQFLVAGHGRISLIFCANLWFAGMRSSKTGKWARLRWHPRIRCGPDRSCPRSFRGQGGLLPKWGHRPWRCGSSPGGRRGSWHRP